MPTKSRQTKELTKLFRLPGLVVSPYYQAGWGAYKTTYMAKARVISLTDSFNPGAIIMAFNDDGSYQTTWEEPIIALTLADMTSDQIKAAVISGSKANLEADSGLTFADSDYSFAIPTLNNRSFSNPSLAINTSRQASTSQDAQVSASVDITTTLSLSGGTAGKVALQYADNTDFTTNVVTVQSFTNSNTGTLTLGLNTSQIGTASLTGIIPVGKYYRLVTTNVTGTSTYGTPVIQEVLL